MSFDKQTVITEFSLQPTSGVLGVKRVTSYVYDGRVVTEEVHRSSYYFDSPELENEHPDVQGVANFFFNNAIVERTKRVRKDNEALAKAFIEKK